MTFIFGDDPTTPDGWERFNTDYFAVMAPKGGGVTGYVDLAFFTKDKRYITCLSPTGLFQLASHLASAVAAMPKPPSVQAFSMGGFVPGDIKPSSETSPYFGQHYDTSVIQALGVLTIRANLLDDALILLESTLTKTDNDIVSNRYYSSTNMKARIDAIRSVVTVCAIPENLANDTIKALELVRSATDRRNSLVHARWTFRKGKHRAEVRRPNAKEKIREITVTESMVLDIAEAYSLAYGSLLAIEEAVSRYRQ